jgi:hypothetical protein
MAPRLASRTLATAAIAGALALTLGTSSTAADADEECPTSDVDYSVAGDLLLKDTQFGAANGLYKLGDGRLKLRFERAPDGARSVHLMSYDLENHFTVKASFAAWSTAVETQSRTTVASACEGAAVGTLDRGDVVWSTPVGGYHSDGSLACTGNVCGKFGAPPAGTSPLHEAASVKFSTFHFAPDGKTFTMDYTRLSHSDSPKQTSYLSLSGRETKRACLPVAPICQR